MIALLGIYLCIAGICLFVGAALTESDDEYEKNIFKNAFYIQREIRKHTARELNTLGVIISVIIATIFLLPCNLLLLAIHIIMKFGELLWHGFKIIFKKKEQE